MSTGGEVPFDMVDELPPMSKCFDPLWGDCIFVKLQKELQTSDEQRINAVNLCTGETAFFQPERLVQAVYLSWDALTMDDIREIREALEKKGKSKKADGPKT